jgi:hypothetical protein
MDWTEGRFIDLLPELQAVAARYAGPMSYDHPGQLAWGSVFEGEAPAVIAGGDAYGILEAPHWLQAGGNPDRAAEVLDTARGKWRPPAWHGGAGTSRSSSLSAAPPLTPATRCPSAFTGRLASPTTPARGNFASPRKGQLWPMSGSSRMPKASA